MVVLAACVTASANVGTLDFQVTGSVKPPTNVSGTYSSEWGTVVLIYSGTSVKGYWIMDSGRQGTIESGTLDERSLILNYTWGDQTGVAVFSWSDGAPPRWEGNYRHSDGLLGPWNLTRTGDAPAEKTSTPSIAPKSIETKTETPGRIFQTTAPAPTTPSPPPPPSIGNWRSAGSGDCPDGDVASSTGSNPDPAKCNASFKGFTAVCWDDGCTYKNVTATSCTGGANPGRMFTCDPGTTGEVRAGTDSESAVLPPPIVKTRATRPAETERSDVFRPTVKIPPLQTTPLISRDLSPSAAAQSISHEDKLEVTVPGGLLAQKQTLAISSVANPPAPAHPGLRHAAVYDVSLGEEHELDGELRITFSTKSLSLPAGLSPAALSVAYLDQYQQAWVNVPCDVDLKEGLVTARTRHLSTFALMVYGGGDDYVLHADGDFVAHFDRKEVRALTVPRFPRDSGVSVEVIPAIGDITPPKDADRLPGYIAVIMSAARDAVAAYRKIGLDLYTKPIHIYVTGTGSSQHSSVTNNITMTCQALDEQELRYAVAHELFHNVQVNYYTVGGIIARRWWMECTAEYAASRIALPHYANMGKLDQAPGNKVPERFLSQYLTYAHTPKYEFVDKALKLVWGNDPWQYHAYQGAYFLEFLAREGLRMLRSEEPKLTEQEYFARMFKAVATGGLETMPALDDFLTKQHGLRNNLARQYDRFVPYFLFDPASPMPAYASDPARVNPAAMDASVVIAPDATDAQLHTFNLVGGHSAKAWEITAQRRGPISPRGFEVMIDGDVPAYVSVYARKVKSSQRGANVGPAITFEYPKAKRKVANISLADDEALYIVAINDYFSDQSVTVRVKERRLILSKVSAGCTVTGNAAVKWGDGRDEVGSFDITADLSQQPLNLTKGTLNLTGKVDKPGEEQYTMTLTAKISDDYQAMKVDLTIMRETQGGETVDHLGVTLTNRTKESCTVQGVELKFRSYPSDNQWDYSGEIPASAITAFSHISSRLATDRKGERVPRYSLSKDGTKATGGSVYVSLKGTLTESLAKPR